MRGNQRKGKAKKKQISVDHTRQGIGHREVEASIGPGIRSSSLSSLSHETKVEGGVKHSMGTSSLLSASKEAEAWAGGCMVDGRCRKGIATCHR
jgi:hypothetical protein